MRNYDAEIALAEQVATAAHADQTDKAGAPYIGHPRRVALRVWEDCRAVAWLHDVVEDSDVTLEDLARQFRPEIVAAVEAITHRDGEPREAYYRRVAANYLAYEVKLADIADNSDPKRLALLDVETRTRLEAKYSKARRLLAQFRAELRAGR